jgi:hypothetical protein
VDMICPGRRYETNTSLVIVTKGLASPQVLFFVSEKADLYVTLYINPCGGPNRIREVLQSYV